ncbi:MAG TPA: hypothetical protein VHB21_01470 [Minicystis sp.]|nr:hypothetical protein [Minicystis sp.]
MEIFVVSGLPRSGTSMMMRMLKAGGLPLVEDGQRTADEDNPHGYFELEAVKALNRDTGWLDGAKGKVVKVISQLLYDLPTEHTYRVVFMRRHIDEIVASQREMLRRNGKTTTPEEDQEIRRLSIQHLNEIIDWLAKQPNMKVLYVNYARAGEPASIEALRNFIPVELDEPAMKAAIDARLYRNRHAPAG